MFVLRPFHLRCRSLLQPRPCDQHWVCHVGSLYSRLQCMSLSKWRLPVLGNQWHRAFLSHSHRPKPDCRLLPVICKLLCTKKELYSNFGLYAPDPLGQHIFCKWINLERLQCLCVQTRQTKIGDNNCQASKHILYVVDHGSLYWHYAKCWQWLHRQVLIPFSPPWVSYNASWPDCEVAFNSLVVCWV